MIPLVFALITTLAQPGTPRSAQQGVIMGRILAADGTPASGQRIAAISAEESATASMAVIRAANDDGRYELEGVPTGRYYIIVGPLDIAAYFPGVLDRSQATAITVAPGARVENINFQMPAIPSAVEVRGILLKAEASIGVGGVEVRLNGADRYTVLTRDDGSFEFPEVRRGAYQATAATTAGRSLDVVAGAMDVTGLRLISEPGFRVAGMVTHQNGKEAKLPSKALRLVGGGNQFVAQPAADGSFAFPYIPSGNYRVEIDAIPFGPMTVNVHGADVTNVEVLIPDGFRIAGRVVWEAGNPPPMQAQLNGPGRRAIVQIGIDGSFEFLSVVPGAYRITLLPAPPTPLPPAEITVTTSDVTDVRMVVRDPKTMDLAGLLESSNPLDQAWGAWLAAEGARTELRPLIEKVVEAHAASPVSASTEAIELDTALDALIRFDATIPLTTLQPLFVRRPAQTFVLLSRLGPSADSFLLTLVNKQLELPWFAAANLLLQHRTPGFAAVLLRELQLEATLMACDPDRTCFQPRGGSRGSGDAFSYIQANYPPWPDYTLTPSISTRGGFLPTGPVPVFVERRVLPNGSSPTPDLSTHSPSSPTGEDLLTYIRAVAPGARVALKEFEDRSTEWHGAEALEAEAQSFRREIESRYSTMIDDLLRAGALTPAEAAEFAKPNLSLTVHDMRTVK